MTVLNSLSSRLILITILCCCCYMMLVQPAAAKIYRWVDERGQLHFTDSPQNIPDSNRSKATEYKPDPSAININAVPDVNNIQSGSGGKPETDTSISIPYIAREGHANRIIIDVTFNGSVTAPMLVDTGSPGLVISSSLASRLDLQNEDDSQLMVLISGIGGQRKAIRTIVERVAIGGIEVPFVPTHIVPQMSSAYQGLIGMDILSGYRLTIDSAKHRLIATPLPNARELPAGRNQSWWQANFKEFNYYINFWQEQASLVGNSDSKYAQLSASQQDRVESFIEQQLSEARKLHQKLDRFARRNSVPRHWRR